MSHYKFSPAERFAIFTLHGEKCYLCGRPLSLLDIEIDHIIPEALLNDRQKLAEVIKSLGRPNNFAINSYANWLPACRKCNNEKSDTMFEPSPIVQIRLQNALSRAAEAQRMEEEIISDRRIANAINALQRAHDKGRLNELMLSPLAEIVYKQASTHRKPELANEPLRLAPLFTVLGEKDGIRMIKGPYGIGGGSTNPHAPACPVCGHKAWNGTRCVICGDMNDD